MNGGEHRWSLMPWDQLCDDSAVAANIWGEVAGAVPLE
ncbi:unnamed protein product [Mycetohabitans rhizoxinica HKI 454]|uniref:Uncharacterized protein n=1 Tax=Mycetohabitans rhizoxinica (strain DSM 19002 / CIP 109453 / HKI 454) TaxID=882378 RepID=E5APJ3_MYCRK|nr:unnamed protein product [Mycetohabitans rhizoxinica HKI 454]